MCFCLTVSLFLHRLLLFPHLAVLSRGTTVWMCVCVRAHAHTHTHTHTQILLSSITSIQQAARLFHSFSIFNLLMCCCIILPHELTRLSAMRVSGAANYSMDVSVTRIMQPTGRLSFTELKAMQSLLKDLVWTGAVTFQPSF